MTTSQPGSGSMVRRIMLGSQLRRLREAQGVTREAAGYSIRASESKISRMELGRVSFKERDVADLLALYGVADQVEREALIGLVSEANAPGWWHSYGDVLPGWFQTYVGLEESASLIRTFEVQFVHGLLQTEEYAHAVFTLGHPDGSPTDIDRRVGLRMERQKLLVSERAPEYIAVLDEGALRRAFGGRRVMRAQLGRLIEAADQPQVSIRLLSFDVGGHSAGGGAFTLLRFPESDLSDVVYLEQFTGSMYLDKYDEVDQYDKAMETLLSISLSPERTVERLRSILRND